MFDTICGATQERQDALFEMLKAPMDLMLVVGGYNSSNTTHLVEIAEQELPTFFIRDAGCLKTWRKSSTSTSTRKTERTGYTTKLSGNEPVTVGITAGASCPNNLIEETILRIFALRGTTPEQILGRGITARKENGGVPFPEHRRINNNLMLTGRLRSQLRRQHRRRTRCPDCCRRSLRRHPHHPTECCTGCKG